MIAFDVFLLGNICRTEIFFFAGNFIVNLTCLVNPTVQCLITMHEADCKLIKLCRVKSHG